MKIYIGTDHGGFELKEKLKKQLLEKGFEVMDMGAKTLDPEDDYVDWAAVVAEELEFDPESFGVLLCRNGVGVSIVANRFAGVRCALGFDLKQVERARVDDDVNCLAIPADYVDDKNAFDMVLKLVETKFSGEDKYVRRLEKLALLQAGGGCACGGSGHCQC